MVVSTIKINASPTKTFFIEMLTRDIKLIDCILDLIDNSIDSILHKTKFDPMKGLFNKEKKSLKDFEISIKFNKKEFIIEDNSEGINKKNVEDNAFRFGSIEHHKKEFGLSVYGIGMKRAFLKIGKKINFESITNKDAIKIEMDINKWINEKENEWKFQGKHSPKKRGENTGTKIVIKNINKQIAINFGNKEFETKLIERIEEVYGIFLKYGLTIKINNKRAKPVIPTISQSKILKPYIRTFEKYGVKVKIIAGVTTEDSKKSNGWYIFCNGRLILRGDTTETTGWGDGLRKFHPSTNRFIGLVYFESKNVEMLPWTTTKDNVDYESAIYQYTLNEMVKVAKPVVGLLVSQYQKDKEMVKLRRLVDSAKEISISELKKSNEEFIADINKMGGESKKEKIEYQVTKNDITKIKKLIDNNKISNSDIGKMAFYYFIDHEE